MPIINTDGFEQKFRQDIDPWNHRSSPFEQQKRRVLLNACGCDKRGRVIELACAIGETTRELAPECLRLTAVDGSPTALAETRVRVSLPQAP